jgi:hypothetical protein
MEDIINNINWVESKTYASFAPHEYFLEENDKESFGILKDKIKTDGVDELFTMPARGDKSAYTLPYRYWYYNGFKYWQMGNVLNRTKIVS